MDGALVPHTSYPAINVISYGLVPRRPGAAGTGLHHPCCPLRSAPQAAPAFEEQGSLDLTIEPMGSNTR
jgi:hypothetical protein